MHADISPRFRRADTASQPRCIAPPPAEASDITVTSRRAEGFQLPPASPPLVMAGRNVLPFQQPAARIASEADSRPAELKAELAGMAAAAL